jgi:uncharacterized protein YacL
LLDKIKTFGSIIALILSIFCFVYFGAWTANGIYGTHFDLPALINLLKSIGDFLSLIVAKFGIDSLLNTEIPWINKIKGVIGNETGNTERHPDNG